MDFAAINSVGKSSNFLPTKKMKDLTKDVIYSVTRIERVPQSKFGEQVVVDINKQFTLWLPKKMKNFLLSNANELEKLIDCTKKEKLGIQYIGDEHTDFKFVERNL